jgi:hypothetical protein
MRQLTPYAQSSKMVNALLTSLIDESTDEKGYAASFYELGKALLSVTLQRFALTSGKVMLACSSEDADWLSKGILDQLGENNIDAKLAVFWNLRVNLNNDADLSIAPITKSYIEPADKVDYLIICKSIISSSCVVRTNLTYIIETINPIKILIVSPVLFKQAIPNLKDEFPITISNKFEFIYFAEDDELNESNEVVPGIGGSVYKRLGLEDSINKNKYIPNIVKERRIGWEHSG